MKAPLLLTLFALTSLFGGPPRSDPRVEELFEKMAFAPSTIEANEAATDLLRLWTNAESPTTNLLMDQAAKAADESGDTERAAQILARVVALDPAYTEAYTRRAALRYKQEDLSGTLQDLQTVLRREPRHFVAWTGVGAVLEDVGDFKGALIAYREALKVYPNFDGAKRGEARMAARLEGLPS